MPKKKTDTSPPSLEDSLASLENIAEALESDELPLEEALAAFEKGIGLARQAQKTLAEAEQRVYTLMEEDGDVSTVPLTDAEDSE